MGREAAHSHFLSPFLNPKAKDGTEIGFGRVSGHHGTVVEAIGDNVKHELLENVLCGYIRLLNENELTIAY